MSLTISEEVKQRLAPFLTETNTFLLVAKRLIPKQLLMILFTSILRRMTKCF